MPSSNKTTLGLNLWSGTDKPKKNDFNADNQIIDAVLGDKIGKEILIQRDLVFNSMYVAFKPSWYYKNQLGEVTVYVSVQRTDSANLSSGELATLPAGYRPKTAIEVPVVLQNDVLAKLNIATNGVIALNMTTSGGVFADSSVISYLAN